MSHEIRLTVDTGGPSPLPIEWFPLSLDAVMQLGRWLGFGLAELHGIPAGYAVSTLRRALGRTAVINPGGMTACQAHKTLSQLIESATEHPLATIRLVA